MSAVPAIVVLAGGLATRFPGKLDRPIDGEPMFQRVFRNASATGWPVYVSGNAPYLPKSVAALGARILPDREPGGGPLRAAVSACAQLEDDRLVLLGGDLPNVTAGVLRELDLAWRSGDEAVVAEHDDRLEPLTALYDRTSLLREGTAVLGHGRGAMFALLDRLAVRGVAMPASLFLNVNSPNDLPARRPA